MTREKSIQTKNAFFFSHDSNVRNDEKLVKLRMHHGAEGYGIYFMLIELMMESSNYELSTEYAAWAFSLNVDKTLVKTIVEDFDLFQISEDGTIFYSPSLKKRIAPLEDTREKRRQAGIRSGEARRAKKAAKEAKQAEASNTCSIFVAPKRTEESIEEEIRVEKRKEEKNKEKEIKTKNTSGEVLSPSVPQGGSAPTSSIKNSFSSLKNDLNIANAISISQLKEKTSVKTQTDKGLGAAVVSPPNEKLSDKCDTRNTPELKKYTYF